MKKETLQNIVYSPLHLWFKLHAILPMRILYILSDILYFPLYHIVHYRKKLVSENLRKAFPDKTDKELKQLEQKFYHHFCDYIVETIKLMHISDEEMRRRMKFEQVEIIDRLFAENRSIIILLGHFGNWEWVPSVTLWTHTPDVMFAQIYRPLKNKWFDRFFLKLRSRMYCQTRYVKSHLTNETFGQTVHYRLHVRSNPLTEKHTPLGSIPLARLSRIDRLRENRP